MFLNVQFINSTVLASLQKPICTVVSFCPKKLLSQIDSFHGLLVLATECFLSFHMFEMHSDAFLVC